MSALCTLPEGKRVAFPTLRSFLTVTDGNLGAHLRKLSDAGYIEIVKIFVDDKPRTTIGVSTLGRRAFLEHVQALEEVVRGPVSLRSE